MSYTSAILCNLSNSFGLRDDIAVLERVIRAVSQSLGITIQKPLLRDIRQPHTPHTDIQFHLEIPCFSAIPWAHTNVMLVNPDHWSYAYDVYVHAFDALLFRDPAAMERFAVELAAKGLRANHLYYLPWCDAWQTKDVSPFYSMNQCLDEFVCFVGGSSAKYEYMRALLPFWQEGDPALTVYTTRQDYADGIGAVVGALPNVKVVRQELTKEQQYKLASQYRGHLIGSQGEAFGYAAAHAEVSGAFSLMNRLSVFEFMYGSETSAGVQWLSNQYAESAIVRCAWAVPDAAVVRAELEAAFVAFAAANYPAHFARQVTASKRFEKTQAAAVTLFQDLLTTVKERRPAKGIFHCPPILRVEDCPPISVITPTYNRKKLIDIAFHNMLATDYPLTQIEWIIIEDNEKTPHLAADKVIDFQVQNPSIRVKYIPIEGRMTIGEKRNHAIEQASHEMILFMDDDDHYPSTSFRRRVAWLLHGAKRGETIACCTTLPLYDLNRGISAVNVPPFDLPFCQRISEATLTFKKSAWEERRFPNVSMAEGESWIEGREAQVIEMPPQQLIVAFTHGSNQSSRRVYPKEAAEMPPSCFWGFPKEYLAFIHGLVGVEVEDAPPGK